MPIALLVMFFVSGACGLIYEVVWSREFVLVLGGTTHAVTAVVAAFMGGLGLGSLAGGKWIDRSRANPALVYGLLEGGVALFALLAPLLIESSEPLLSFVCRTQGGRTWVLDLVRICISVGILLPPTFLMGATLPVLVRATLYHQDRYGLTAGRLYALNTLGAMAGAGLAGFVLLPAVGNRLTSWTAASGNLAIFLAVVIFRHRFRAAPAVARQLRPEHGRPPWGPASVAVAAGYGLSGLAALIYQIAWTRSLILTLGGSTYSFSLILVSFIGGLGLGGALITPWVDRIRRPLLWAGVMEFVIGLSAVAVIPLLDNVNLFMFQWFYEYRDQGPMLSLVRMAVTFGIICVPTVVMGALLPLVARVMAGERPGAGEPMGLVYSANTAGAVIGAFLAGYLLLDLFGVRTTVVVATGLSLLIGAAWVTLAMEKRRLGFLLVLLGLAAGARLVSLLPAPDPLITNSGPYIYFRRVMGELGPDMDVRKNLTGTYRTLYFREDAETSVLVIESKINLARSLRINGKSDASTSLDMPNQVLLAHLPLLIHPRPKKVMVLGLASGVTAGSALLHPISRLDCLELSPAVVEASRYFQDVSNLDYSDPRFYIILSDGRNHLALGDETYDVIISEPSNPWQAGQGLLFTREFFQLVRDHLEPGGIAAAWIDVYNMDVSTLSLMLRTFNSVFPHVTLWETGYQADCVMLGSVEPIRVSYALLQSRCLDPRISRDLARINADADKVLERFIMDEAAIREAVGEGPVHTDDRRQLEFEMPKTAFTQYQQRLSQMLDHVFYRHVPATGIVEPFTGEKSEELSKRLLEMDSMREEVIRKEVLLLSPIDDKQEVIDRTEKFIHRLGDHYVAQGLAVELAIYMNDYAAELNKGGRVEEAMVVLAKSFDVNPKDSLPASMIANHLFFAGSRDQSESWAQKALDTNKKDHLAWAVMARLARTRGEYDREESFWTEAARIEPDNLNYRIALARSLIDQDKLAPATDLLEQAMKEQPDNSDAHFFMGIICYKRGDLLRARQLFERTLVLDPDHPSRELIEKTLLDLRARTATK